MKQLLTILLLALTTGCAHHYDVSLYDGSVIRATTKPVLNERGYYIFKDGAGGVVQVNKLRVRQIEPAGSRSSADNPFK